MGGSSAGGSGRGPASQCTFAAGMPGMLVSARSGESRRLFRGGLTAFDHTGVAGAERILAFRETTEESQGIFALGNLGDWSRKSLEKQEGEKERYSREYKTHF